MENRKHRRYFLNIPERGTGAGGRVRMIKRALGYEFIASVFENKWKYTIPVAIALHNCVVNLRMPGRMWQGSDYLWDFLKGIPTVQADSQESFLLPGGWMAFFVLLLYFHGRTAKNYTGGMGQQILLRSGSAGRFWNAKWTGCIGSTFIWFGGAYLAIILFCAAMPGESLDKSDSLNWIDGKQICVQLFLPLLAACVMGIWQLVLSICVGSIFGLLGVYCCLIISAYFTKWYLPGNYLMKIRIEEMLESQVTLNRMFVFLTVLLTMGILSGYDIMRRSDYLAMKSDF